MTEKIYTVVSAADVANYDITRYEKFYISALEDFEKFISSIKPKDYTVTTKKIKTHEFEILFHNKIIVAQFTIQNGDIQEPLIGTINFYLRDFFDDEEKTFIASIQFQGQGYTTNITNAAGQPYNVRDDRITTYIFNYILNKTISAETI